jgi:hypothetical protein
MLAFVGFSVAEVVDCVVGGLPQQDCDKARLSPIAKISKPIFSDNAASS